MMDRWVFEVPSVGEVMHPQSLHQSWVPGPGLAFYRVRTAEPQAMTVQKPCESWRQQRKALGQLRYGVIS